MNINTRRLMFTNTSTSLPTRTNTNIHLLTLINTNIRRHMSILIRLLAFRNPAAAMLKREGPKMHAEYIMELIVAAILAAGLLIIAIPASHAKIGHAYLIKI